ncbi:MAG: hypothetical protein QW117_01190 [Candidatus Pacearchaeota archaeon]
MKKERKAKIFLLLCIFGLLILFYIQEKTFPKVINICEIEKLKENEYVSVYGKVIEERELAKNFYLLILENSSCKLEIICNCKNFTNKNIEVIGKISYYKNKTQINAEKIIEIK